MIFNCATKDSHCATILRRGDYIENLLSLARFLLSLEQDEGVNIETQIDGFGSQKFSSGSQTTDGLNMDFVCSTKDFL